MSSSPEILPELCPQLVWRVSFHLACISVLLNESLILPRQSADRCFDISLQRVPLTQHCSDLQAVLLLQSPPSSKPPSSVSENLLSPLTTAATPVLQKACNTPGSSCHELPTPPSFFPVFQLYSPYLLLSMCSALLYNLYCFSSPKPL